MNDKLHITLLTDEALVERLEDMAKVEQIWSHQERATVLHEAARRITDMRTVIDDSRRMDEPTGFIAPTHPPRAENERPTS